MHITEILKDIPFDEIADKDAVFHLCRRIKFPNTKYVFFIKKTVNDKVTNIYNLNPVCKLKPIGI